MDGYRKELKYIVSESVLKDVENRISGLARIDAHQKGDFYRVRSIYLDTPDYKCLRENQAGISTREKYRIRIYDCLDTRISAEVKIRHRDTISKMSTLISRDTLNAILSNDIVRASNCLINEKSSQRDDSSSRVLDKYLYKLAGEHYKSAVIVDYERSAYVYDMCNVRITFDRNVSASCDFDRFFDDGLLGIPAISDSNHVLEIKYDEFLPSEIADVLAGVNLTRSSCSKYVKCVCAAGWRN